MDGATDAVVPAAQDAGVVIYRGTSITSELQIHAETGQLMSDAARVGYVESGGSIEAARAAFAVAHTSGTQTWGSEAYYAEAHGAFGTELKPVRAAVDDLGNDRSGDSQAFRWTWRPSLLGHRSSINSDTSDA